MVGIHPHLQSVVELAIKLTLVDFVVLEGVRTPERQAELVDAGASRTLESRHLTGHAVDVAAWLGTVRWELPLYYGIAYAFQQASRQLDIPIRWGGSWSRLDLTTDLPEVMVEKYVRGRSRAFVDSGHFELPKTVYE